MGDKYSGTNAVLLGDRVSLQTIKIQNGMIIVDYADRRPDEPMASPASFAKTKYLAVKNGRLEEIKPLGKGERAWVTPLRCSPRNLISIKKGLRKDKA
jgi:hypothetical protein